MILAAARVLRKRRAQSAPALMTRYDCAMHSALAPRPPHHTPDRHLAARAKNIELKFNPRCHIRVGPPCAEVGRFLIGIPFHNVRKNPMNISITGHQIDLTGALRTYVREKLSRIERHFDHVIDTHVILKVDKLVHLAEATISTSGKRVHAESSQADMYAAIDDLVDKLDRQIKKHKEKLAIRTRPAGLERGAALG